MNIKPQYTYFLLLIFIMIWCFLIIAAPFFAHLKLVIPSGIIYLFFSKICHQIPNRSFFIWDKQFSVCARCTGIYCGFGTGALLFPLITNIKKITPPKIYLLLLGILPLSLDLTLTLLKIWENTFFSRFCTGFLLGCIVAFFIIPGLYNLSKIREEDYGI